MLGLCCSEGCYLVVASGGYSLVEVLGLLIAVASLGSDGKESTYNVGDLGLTPGLGRSPGKGKGYPFQYSGLENSMDCIVSRIRIYYKTSLPY